MKTSVEYAAVAVVHAAVAHVAAVPYPTFAETACAKIASQQESNVAAVDAVIVLLAKAAQVHVVVQQHILFGAEDHCLCPWPMTRPEDLERSMKRLMMKIAAKHSGMTQDYSKNELNAQRLIAAVVTHVAVADVAVVVAGAVSSLEIVGEWAASDDEQRSIPAAMLLMLHGDYSKHAKQGCEAKHLKQHGL